MVASTLHLLGGVSDDCYVRVQQSSCTCCQHASSFDSGHGHTVFKCPKHRRWHGAAHEAPYTLMKAVTPLCRCHMDWSDFQIHLQVGRCCCLLPADPCPQKLFCMSTPCAGLPLLAWWAPLIIQAPPDKVLPCCRLDYFSVSAATGKRATSSPLGLLFHVQLHTTGAACCHSWLLKGCPACKPCTTGASAALLACSCCLVCTSQHAPPGSTAAAQHSEACHFTLPLLCLSYSTAASCPAR